MLCAPLIHVNVILFTPQVWVTETLECSYEITNTNAVWFVLKLVMKKSSNSFVMYAIFLLSLALCHGCSAEYNIYLL